MKRVLIPLCILLVACSTQKKKEVEPPNDVPPKMLMPEVKKIWIPPALKNNGLEWEAGHFLYQISRGSSWSR